MRHNFFRLTSGNSVEFFLECPGYYEKYLQLIDSAQKTLHLQTYIFEPDGFGNEVQAALIRAAQRGVAVFLLVDSVGSRKLTSEASQKMIKAGIHFCRFNGLQIKWLYQWGRRLHHKILLIDHQKAFVGGINVISSCYNSKTLKPQLDFALYLEGPVTLGLTRYCHYVFRKSSAKKIKFKSPLATECINHVPGIDLKISINDWVLRRWQITRQYSTLTKIAQSDITIVNSYFFPRKKFMRQLAAASKRGVKVRLILPKISDWPSYILASQYLYAYFLKHGIEIYEWKNSILHGKLATIDNTWATVGSFNLNYTSYQQNLEMNVNILSKEITSTINQSIEQIINTGCDKINAEEFILKRSFGVKLKRFFYYVIMAMLANFSVGLIFQDDERGRKRRFYSIIRVTASVVLFIIGVIGALVPVMPGLPFLLISFLLLYRQIVLNNRNV
ncbi:MAG: hypothetical protein H7061_10015 [Bdellovibrionaceae bacterium]|nr:hypothetical protein [Bdellovibrio sp.]